jgi:RNA polymerase sigma-70 factor (ECF subfamily)
MSKWRAGLGSPQIAHKNFIGGTVAMEPDLVLVEKARRGDSLAWEALVRRHSRRLYSLCHRYAGKGDWAEDLTQEAFLRIFRHLDQFRAESGSFANWIIRITRNLLIDHYRKNRQAEQSLVAVADSEEGTDDRLENLPSVLPSPHSEVESGEEKAALRNAMKQLSPPLRQAVILRYLMELSYREMAALLRVSDGTVKSRISRGRTELARKMESLHFIPQSSMVQ